MKAVILAAGIGSRLRPITEAKPKCMVNVAGMPILEHQISAYLAAGVSEVIIVAGYRADELIGWCEQRYPSKVRVIVNNEYSITNNMYSLYLLRNEISAGEFVLSNGDVVFEPSIIRDVVNHADSDLIATDVGSYSEESMKIIVRGGRIIDISKAVSPTEAYGNSIDLYRFSKPTSKILFDEITRAIESEGQRGQWTEVAIQRIVAGDQVTLRPFDIGARNWVEIDNYTDLSIADRLFGATQEKMQRYQLLFIDLDGTIYLGAQPVPGASKWISALQKEKRPFYFLSNNSSRSKADYVLKLADMGIVVSEDSIVLSTDGLIEYLLTAGIERVFVVGTESMRSSIEEAGVRTNANDPQAVVLGYDTELTYEKIKQAAIYLSRGIDLIATHCDIVCPTPDGPIPDIGAMLVMFETALNIKPKRVFGKPNADMVAHLIRAHGAVAEEVAIVGDRLYTDFELARSIGSDFILVLSGESKREEVEVLQQQPALIIQSVVDLLEDEQKLLVARP